MNRNWEKEIELREVETERNDGNGTKEGIERKGSGMEIKGNCTKGSNTST